MPARLGPTRWRLVGIVVSLAIGLGALPVRAAERFDFHSIRRAPDLSGAHGRFEGETHFLPHGNARFQGMRGYGRQWSGDAHFLWDGVAGQEARLRWVLGRSSRYRIVVQLTRAPDYGVCEILVDDQPAGVEVDLFSSRVELAPPVTLPEMSLKAGAHVLTLKLTGANPQAQLFKQKGYLLGVDYFQLVDLAPAPQIAAAKKAAAGLDVDVAAVDRVDAQELLTRYCAECHSGDEPQGEVRLSEVGRGGLAELPLERIEKIADALAFGTMPPEDADQPEPPQRRRLARFFEGQLVERTARTESVVPTVMRRMTRYEYNNAVRDLLELKGDVYPLPERTLRAYHEYYRPATGVFPERIRVGNRTLGKNQVEKDLLDGVSPFAIDLQAEHGFNNRGDQLSLSPLLLETLLKLGKSIVESPQFREYCRAYDRLFVGTAPRDQERDLELGRQRLKALLRRAFRQPVDTVTWERYGAFFEGQYARHGSYTVAMKRTVAGILASPRFLYLVETGAPTDAAVPLSEYELATRLSFFLWNTIPDVELGELAAAGRLSDPAVLRQQVQRMLTDSRSRALAENFARQWLRLDQLITAVPSMERFPHYSSRIGCEQWKFGLQMMVEPLLLFESVVVEDRSVMLLVDSNYSYRSDELQSWYDDAVPLAGKGNVNRFDTFQQEYKRRDLSTRRQGGVITTAATMTMTSSPLRTRPISRGAWVATVILNRPPPPPPDSVPEIEADDDAIEAKGITLRERLQQHQVNSACVSCHAAIDPLGFALEQYDAVGRWRETYRSGLPVDASGRLFGEVEFSGIEELKDRLLERPEIFMRAFTEHLLSYALGRPLRPVDRTSVNGMVRRIAADHGRFSTAITEVVTSRSFRYKKANESRRQP
ncbi:MAG: DUF1592 domain-containing protein [Planctomycetota bacterium]|nr:DUF1592 domain-containing protein [Planctomycetota bacterium]